MILLGLRSCSQAVKFTWQYGYVSIFYNDLKTQ